MHFLNPAAVLALFEVIRGAQTSERTVAGAIELAERLGKTPVLAADRPGFIVNRAARPYSGEALRLAGEGVAALDKLDWIMVSTAGFPMRPIDWIREFCPSRVLVVLDRLCGEDHEARYRASILLRRWARNRLPMELLP